jgi:cyclase
MEIVRINSIATAFIRPIEGVNAGLIHTPKGMILIDTTSSPAEIKALFEAVGVHPEEVHLVVNTHSHSDHTWGNQVFACPILAHRLCLKRMRLNLKSYWSPKTFRSYLSNLEKTEPQKADELRRVLEDLHITLPTQTFDERWGGELGGLNYEIIHMGGHTPDLSVVWLPEKRVLFASDLIFQGRYPYIFDADIPAWIEALGKLLEFDARAIIPGHGVMGGEADIIALREYLRTTWALTAEHIRQGHSANKAASDPAYPRFAEKQYERLHKANIRYMYKKQAG